MRHRGRVDTNQRDIVAALRAAGASVQSLSNVGQGCPDLLVAFRGVNHLLEVKDGSKPPSARKLTADEQNWHDRWRSPVAVVNSVDEALEAIGATVDSKGGSFCFTCDRAPWGNLSDCRKFGHQLSSW